jgi:hypothetical protein
VVRIGNACSGGVETEERHGTRMGTLRFYDIFNGDADGLCALQQLRLAEPRKATLVTGAKRDIALLDRIDAGPGDRVTVLDVSMQTNTDGLARALAAGAHVQWFDHHQTGTVPKDERLDAHLDLAPSTCTSLIVDRHLDGRFRAWGVVGAFGDNLTDSARKAAQSLGLPHDAVQKLKRLGECLNYNAYGSAVEELLFHPEDLHRRMRSYVDPLAFAERDPAFPALDRARTEDLMRALAVVPALETTGVAAVVLPDESWSRRVSGTLANHPTRAHAVFVPERGRFTVSLRAPRSHPFGADRIAAEFSGGGGRAAAAGINGLPEADVPRVLAALQQAYP